MVLTRLGTFSLRVSVDTKNMEGKESVSVMVLYDYKENPVISVGSIFFEVVPQDSGNISE